MFNHGVARLRARREARPLEQLDDHASSIRNVGRRVPDPRTDLDKQRQQNPAHVDTTDAQHKCDDEHQ